MKRNKVLIKLVALLVFVLIISCFMVGCDTPNHDLDSEQGNGNKTNSGVKPIIDALYINYDFPEDYNANDKIVIELFLGTAESKAYIELIKDYYGEGTHTFEELTTLKVYATIREGTLTNQERSSIFMNSVIVFYYQNLQVSIRIIILIQRKTYLQNPYLLRYRKVSLLESMGKYLYVRSFLIIMVKSL